jgi:hypothetical protein
MALSTYAELQASIALWLMRDDLTAPIVDFITLAEARLNKKLRVREMETTPSAITLTSGVGALPSDFLEARRLVANSDPISVLSYITPDQAATEYGANTITGGWARYYTIIGTNFTVYPTTTSTCTLTYYQKVPALSVSATTNWLLTKAPDVYLYGALAESAPYLADDQRLQIWLTMYQAAVNDLQNADQLANYSRATSRIKGATP